MAAGLPQRYAEDTSKRSGKLALRAKAAPGAKKGAKGLKPAARRQLVEVPAPSFAPDGTTRAKIRKAVLAVAAKRGW